MKSAENTNKSLTAADSTEGALDNALKVSFAANDVLSIVTVSAEPANDEPFVAELTLGRGYSFDALSELLAQDPEYAIECDRRRDAWLARVECEDDRDEESSI